MKKILTLGLALLMLISLSACGSQLKKEVAVNNFKEISCEVVGHVDATYDDWYDSENGGAIMVAAFMMEGGLNKNVDLKNLTYDDEMILGQDKADKRYDVLIPRKDGSIYYIQYWPESAKAKMGSKELTTTVTDYADKLVKAKIIERYEIIPLEIYYQVMKTVMGGLFN